MKNYIISFVVIIALIAIVLLARFGSQKSNSDVKDSTNTPITQFANRPFFTSADVKKSMNDYYKVSNTYAHVSTQQSHYLPTPNVKDYNYVTKKITSIKTELTNVQDITLVDKQLVDFIQDKNISRVEKINSLWNLMLDFGISSPQGGYLLDYLGALQPVELAHYLVDLYSPSLLTERKIQLVNVLRGVFGMDNLTEQTPEQLEFIAKQENLVRNFLSSQLNNEQDSNAFRQLLFAYSYVSPSEEIIPLMQNLLSNTPDKVSQGDILKISLDISFANQEVQNKFLPSLLDSLKDIPDKTDFNSNLYSFLEDKNIDSLLDNAVKPKVIEYLQSQQPNFSSEQFSSDQIYEYYHWLKSSVAVTGINENQRTEIMLNAITQDPDPIRQASVLVLADKEIIDGIKSSELSNSLAKTMQSTLDNKNLSDEQKHLLSTAIQEITP